MSNLQDTHTSVDVSLVTKLFNCALNLYGQKVNVPAEHLTPYIQSEIANAVRMSYAYIVRNAESDQEKIALLTDEETIKFASLSLSIYESITTLRYNSLSKGMNMYSQFSFAIESTLTFLINTTKPMSHMNPTETLLADLFLKFFSQSLGLLRMLNLDLASEAYSNWRTVHEAECVIKLLVDGGKPLRDVYIRHLVYNNAFRHAITNKTESDKIFAELKEHMSEHGLKSKDMKKYIEYGWLYSCQTYHEEDKKYKLNFRDGLQKAAGLGDYNQWYEMASELIHSSPIFFYANNAFFEDLTTVNLSDIIIRGNDYFDKYLLEAGIDLKDNQTLKDMLILNLKTQGKKEDDTFYTKYKEFIGDDSSSDDNLEEEGQE